MSQCEHHLELYNIQVVGTLALLGSDNVQFGRQCQCLEEPAASIQHHEDRGRRFLQNTDKYPPDYIWLYTSTPFPKKD
jgi:hypothetical protein